MKSSTSEDTVFTILNDAFQNFFSLIIYRELRAPFSNPGSTPEGPFKGLIRKLLSVVGYRVPIILGKTAS